MAKTADDVPAGMRLVSRDQFFEALGADPRDIMPVHDRPHETFWKVQARGVVGEVFGWSTPGWKNPGDPKLYATVATEKSPPG